MEYNRLVDWLFENTKLRPQLGFAGADKRAWLWLPGRKRPDHATVTRAIERAPLRGCTQVAYESVFEPMAGQRCEVCWVGLDIDAEDNPGIDLTAIDFPFDCSMVRTSCSGKGIHVIYRLFKPVSCTHETAGKVVVSLTAALVEYMWARGLKVCKADRRMFWLAGGNNRTLFVSPHTLHPTFKATVIRATTVVRELLGVSDEVLAWAEKLGLADVKKSNPCYVGDVVDLLRSHGEKVTTQSSMRGNGQINGYLDVTQFSISLWSYADGHVIWSYTDVEGMLNADNS